MPGRAVNMIEKALEFALRRAAEIFERPDIKNETVKTFTGN